MKVPMDVGQVVISTAGHDKGRTFVIVGQAGDSAVLIADGAGSGSIDWVRERILSRVSIYDHEIRKHLEPFQMPHKEG